MKLSKKDLMNTYIQNDNGKVLKTYMAACASVGLHTFHDGEQAFDADFYSDGEFVACNEYSHPKSEGVLQLFMNDDDLGRELTWRELSAMSINKIPTQTPEEKEAFDSLNGIPREHLMAMIKKQSDTIKELSGKLSDTPHQYEMGKFVESKAHETQERLIDEIIDKSEWKNGDAAIWEKFTPVTVIGKDISRGPFSNEDKYVVSFDYDDTDENGVPKFNSVWSSELSKPKSPEEKEQREKEEAAWELYKFSCSLISEFDRPISATNWKELSQEVKEYWLAMVDKTNYRKGE